ncbi:hypothetical protein LTR10_016965 [Elasticomyces elasticus]|uniref:Uncharacterized protein n=1 Tax=Exophiala sideris TaxID=1016849 RepID=A0ABR0JF16_9EURO|nr:hypothetical protein LTR10_016965 [Elasticomyces elasticus]KAK5025219.1 hypothetical protein LTS07_008070 [Exophiala sideris]KAK5029233.1 hypothetical protein LTR13_008770 [Exophiala sideris]KAK5063278.1 hypothetical protein LTR69_003984 [Exophiala sideris]KAK5178994.1 hypothetical protein LTR44_008483 [Eurotiomycetes sp. CCFEE 6388]
MVQGHNTASSTSDNTQRRLVFGGRWAESTQETLDASAAIANMRLTGKYFENEDDFNEFWAQYWSLLQAASGVGRDDVEPNLILSAEYL